MTLRSLQQLLVACMLTATAAAAADNPFSGTWKMNPSKSVLTDQMKVEAAGPNTYTLIFGNEPETIVADGADHPGLYGTTFSITVVSPNEWKGTRKKEGHLQISATWDLSADGNTLTDDFTGYRADGSKSHLLYKYTRTTPGEGFVGTWVSTTEEVNSVYEIEVQPYEGEGLSIINASQKMTQNLIFDGQDHAVEGPNLPDGYAVSGRRLSDRSVEMTRKIAGKVLDTQEIEVSSDGKTLTMTIHIPGRSKPNTQVFDRE